MFSTLIDGINFAVEQFENAGLYYGHGTSNAVDEAAYLILHTLRLPLDTNFNTYLHPITPEESEKIKTIIQLRIDSRKPAPYLTHQAFFMGLDFYVDERVLIPRSPMAELIYHKFQPWISENKINAILDLCTGSGCIAIACAEIFPHAKITASDISNDALTVAEINSKKHQKNINLIQSDVFKNIPEQKFDIIISNPPYVDLEDMTDLPAEYHHEPTLGLAAGTDGLDVVKKILNHAKDYLSDEGILIVEVGNSEAALIELFPDIPFTWLEFEYGNAEVFLLSKKLLDPIV